MDKKELTKIVSAFILGDGCLRIWNNRPNLTAYTFTQTSDHEDYVLWQQKIIEEVTGVNLRKIPASVKNGVNRKEYFQLESKTHPFFKMLRDRWYHDGRKTVSLHDMKQLDFQMLAIWYMDDGYLLKRDNSVFLCTDHFNESEVIMLQKIIYSNLGIAMNVRKRGFKKDGTRIYRLVATKENAEKFREGVRPFIFPSFEYKVRTENSTEK